MNELSIIDDLSQHLGRIQVVTREYLSAAWIQEKMEQEHGSAQSLRKALRGAGGGGGGGEGIWFFYEPLQKTEASEVQAILIYNGN